MSRKDTEKRRTEAEKLMEEAVRNIEEREAGARPSDSDGDAIEELQEVSGERTNKVAQIDLQKYVEREAYLRLAADFENFRKRAWKERQDSERSGREKVLRDFLEILDNLDRGLVQARDDQGALAVGMRMVLSQAEAWLKAEGLKRIESVGEMFDPTIHEAVSQVERSDVETGRIVEEVKRGYRWADRLLRPASVIVARQVSSKQDPSGTGK